MPHGGLTMAAEPVVVVAFDGGQSPVQAHGTINGVPFYFRARYEHWSLGVGGEPIGDPHWWCGEQYGNAPFDAGYMPEEEARAFIARGARWFAESCATEPATIEGEQGA